MAVLITYQQALDHLRLPDELPDDAVRDVVVKMAQASALVLDYLDRPDTAWRATIAAWTTETVPPQVQAAMLELLMELWRFRGDDDIKISPARLAGAFAEGIAMKLKLLHDPSIA